MLQEIVLEHNQLSSIANFVWGVADDVLLGMYVRGKHHDVTFCIVIIRGLDAVFEPTTEAVLGMREAA